MMFEEPDITNWQIPNSVGDKNECWKYLLEINVFKVIG